MTADVTELDSRTTEKAENSRIRHLRKELASLQERQVPHNAELEQALLGAILRNNRVYDSVGDFLEPKHFYVPEHAALFYLIKSKIDRGADATPATLAHLADEDEVCREAGGASYLYELAMNVTTMMNAPEYGRSIYDMHCKRELIGIGEDIVCDTYDSVFDLDCTSEVLIDRYGEKLVDLDSDAARGDEEGKIVTLSEAMADQIAIYDQAFKDPDSIRALPCGLKDLDDMLGGGFQPGRLYILAGRPGMGKSTMMQRIIRGIAERSKQYAFVFNLEMTRQEIAERELAARARINTRLANQGKADAAAFERMTEALDRSRSLPILLDDRPSQTPAGMDRVMRRERRRREIGAVAVDYLQICTPEVASQRYGNKVQEVADMTRAFKQMAKRHQVPVILLSQLSRQVENREDKHPQLSDLRDSGSIEQDADVVLFLYRPEYYLEREEPEQRSNESMEKFAERQLQHEQLLNKCRNILEVGIAKQRGGPTGRVELYCDLSTMTIEDLDRRDGPEGGLL